MSLSWLRFSVSRGCQAPLRGLGLQLELPTMGAPRVLVGRVPLCFTEKEHNEVRRGRPSVIKAVVEVSGSEPPAASPVNARFMLTDGTNAVLSSFAPIRNTSEISSRYALLYLQRHSTLSPHDPARKCLNNQSGVVLRISPCFYFWSRYSAPQAACEELCLSRC